MNRKNIGFVSTRFSGIDGVSLEAIKWAQVLEENGHRCFWFAGKLDRDPAKSFLAPEAHFQYAQNEWINEQVFCRKKRKPYVTEVIHSLRSLLKAQLHCFIDQFDIDLLVVENTLTIPMHIPLGLSLTEVIAETQIPTIAHHHDFCWERPRYSVNGVNDYLQMAFPPKLPNIKHVVINSEAREDLALRTTIPSIIIPNVLDFDNPPLVSEKKTKAFRKSIGLKPGDKMILQPTRIIRRKGIEHTIDLVKELDDPCYKLVISHEAGDEGFEYAKWLKTYAFERQVDLGVVKTKITAPWINNGNHQSEYSLWHIYPNAEFVSFPSL
jgi:glycosyltransferase involved in cell wall biosynthesis